MSKPRRLLPHATYLITRRTILRHMLLRPDSVMTQILVYLLAVAAERTGVQVHAICAMSTHIHLVVTDVDCRLPEFLAFFHRMVALCTMEHRQWKGPIWDKAPTSVVRLETPAAIIQEIAYVLANPVAAGLVRQASEWPGATVLVNELGRTTLRARRPEVYLNPKNWRNEAALTITLPPSIDPAEADTFRRQVGTEVERLEERARAEMEERGRTVLGASAARTVPTTARATSPEPRIDRNPTFAVGPHQGNAWHDAVAAIRAFRASYQSALALWRAGVRSVQFPPGTWLMRVLHGAAVEDAAIAA